jgi:hypothetical protein
MNQACVLLHPGRDYTLSAASSMVQLDELFDRQVGVLRCWLLGK